MNIVKSTYRPEDVTLLLKDITGMVTPMSAQEREPLIQSGVHYCEMLPLEYAPSEEYMRLYGQALSRFSAAAADAVRVLAERIYLQCKTPVLVSLARAGISAGVLVKRYLKNKYGLEVPHYAISIIRGRGIDKNAMKLILSRHSEKNIRFIDGWTGKGAISNQLKAALTDFPGVSCELGVLADPAGVTELCGSREDFLIATSCLNSTVCGLISRTFMRSDIIGPDDFHGAAYYGELADRDRTYEFIDTVMEHMSYDDIDIATQQPQRRLQHRCGMDEVRRIMDDFGIADINLIKPGVGETARVLLRRVPYMVLVRKDCERSYIDHILQLAEEKGVDVREYDLHCYRCCGIIRNMPADT